MSEALSRHLDLRRSGSVSSGQPGSRHCTPGPARAWPVVLFVARFRRQMGTRFGGIRAYTGMVTITEDL